MADIWLIDVGDASLDGFPETPPGEQTFAGGNGHRRGGLYVTHRLDVFGQARFLDEQGVRSFQLPRQCLAEGRGRPAMEVDTELTGGADGFAQAVEALH